MTLRQPRLTAWAMASSVLMAFSAVFSPVTQASTASLMNALLLTMMNSDRVAIGLRPLLLDARLAMVAAERAGVMAGTGQLRHGPDIGAAVSAAGITPFFSGEAIGETNAAWGGPAADFIYDAFRGSPKHWELLTSDLFNYVGIGVSLRPDTGQTFASLVFAEAPDSSPPVAAITGASHRGSTLVFTWSGRDGILQTHTAGLRDFIVDYRVDDGPWKRLRSGTTATSLTLSNRPSGHIYALAVRARDRRLNVSRWVVRSVWVP